ncbi:hypothetical protein LSTR_LSTR012391 [Laodelphax striatellus]|uniref:Major facilitator superfamily (MFS) profile domain-containing protein n=1 Tax=Laodelphax striatellus TaxID=195883 RepID=A0A482WUA5_LAOST|nr:hypothetical protein LSTR_LSTR012391 [Laodelphax striatellus]
MILCEPLEKRTILLIMLFFGFGQCYLLRNVVYMALNVYDFMNVDISSESMEERAVVQFYYGYCVLQIPCGRLSERFGGKTMMGFGILGASILCILIPYAIETGGYNSLGFISVFIGAFLAAYNSAAFNLASKWITAKERGKLVCAFSSLYFGNGLRLWLQLEYSSSKEILFIIPGVSGIIWTLCWYMLVYDSPMTHPSITRQERKHIVLTKESEGTIYDTAIDCPWSEICFDPHVWVVFTTHACFWAAAVFLNQRSVIYLRETFKLSPLEDPLLLVLPFFLSFCSSFISGLLLDVLCRFRISLILVQKIYTIIATIIPAIAFIGFICHNNSMSWSLFFYSLGLAFATWILGGHYTIFLDLAPNFAATLNAMSTTLATFYLILNTKIINSLGAGLERHEQWDKRHCLCSALFFTAGTMFTLFGNNNIADWNTPTFYEDV